MVEMKSGEGKKGATESSRSPSKKAVAPTQAQARWLKMGVSQPGRKLPLFDENGANISPRTIRACIAAGWAEPWFSNPIKPEWLVCKLTDEGLEVISE